MVGVALIQLEQSLADVLGIDRSSGADLLAYVGELGLNPVLLFVMVDDHHRFHSHGGKSIR